MVALYAGKNKKVRERRKDFLRETTSYEENLLALARDSNPTNASINKLIIKCINGLHKRFWGHHRHHFGSKKS